MKRLWILPLLAACVPKVPASPSITQAPAAIVRDSLPETTLRGAVVATTKMSRHLAVQGGEKTEERGPVYVYALEHPEQGLVLIDAGFGRRTAIDPLDHPGRLTTMILDLEMGVPMADLLPAIDSSPGDVGIILLTHLHDDHAAGVEDFPDALLWADRLDWEFADHTRLLRGVEPEPFAGREFRHPTYSHGPWGPFERHTDLFGDGSVLLFPAPGHTPGSMLVLVNTRAHSWLFLGDASWTDDGWLEAVRPKGFLPRTLVETDWKRGMDVLYRVRTLIGRDDLTIVSGHEPANLERLAPWPEPW